MGKQMTPLDLYKMDIGNVDPKTKEEVLNKFKRLSYHKIGVGLDKSNDIPKQEEESKDKTEDE